MASKIPVGNQLYLFMDDSGRPAENLLISSHGGYFSRPELGRQTGAARHIPGLGGWIVVPGNTTLYFYGPHKAALEDPGVTAVGSGKVHYLEVKRNPEKVRNYRLSKYQGEESKETYETIDRDIDQNRQFVTLRQNAVDSGSPTAMAEVQRVCPNPFPKFDVLTVRNRWWANSVTFHDVLSGLAAAGMRYANIHCVFCRSRIVGRSPTHDAHTNPRV